MRGHNEVAIYIRDLLRAYGMVSFVYKDNGNIEYLFDGFPSNYNAVAVTLSVAGLSVGRCNYVDEGYIIRAYTPEPVA